MIDIHDQWPMKSFSLCLGMKSRLAAPWHCICTRSAERRKDWHYYDLICCWVAWILEELLNKRKPAYTPSTQKNRWLCCNLFSCGDHVATIYLEEVNVPVALASRSRLNLRHVRPPGSFSLLTLEPSWADLWLESRAKQIPTIKLACSW